MWPGPYGDGGSRKYLLASLDQSLHAPRGRVRRHLLLAPLRPGHAAGRDDGRCSIGRCAAARPSTRASRRTPSAQTREAAAILAELGTPLLIHQPSYSLLDRWVEHGTARHRRGPRASAASCFSPLAQGLLTDRYLDWASQMALRRAAPNSPSPSPTSSPTRRSTRCVHSTSSPANRGQSLAQMALAWTDPFAGDLDARRSEQPRAIAREPRGARHARVLRRRAAADQQDPPRLTGPPRQHSSPASRWFRGFVLGRMVLTLTRDHLVTYHGPMADEGPRLQRRSPTRPDGPARRPLQEDGRTLTELEAGLAMTRFGVMKHLRLLEEAGLVVTRREGRRSSTSSTRFPSA